MKTNVISAIGGGCLGFLAGYLVSRRRFADRESKEIQAAKEFYNKRIEILSRRNRWTEEEDVEEAPLVPLTLVPQAGAPEEEELSPGVVFQTLKDELDELIAGQPEPEEPLDRTVPYVISMEEFAEGCEGYGQVTITFYMEDRVLVDEQQQPMPDLAGTVGIDIDQKFGVASGDDSIAYIRNEKLELDFEVVKNTGSYVGVVLNYGSLKTEARDPND